MISIDNIYEDLMIINKSKFYSFAYPISSEGGAKEILNDLRERFSDATHVCSAYSLSSPKIEKADDDGEPSGTAGKPMLELIKKRNLDNVLLVVVRYFGGIKLGAGGLVRAYTNSSNLVLDKAQIVEIINKDIYKIEVDLSISAKLMDVIRGMGEIISLEYSEKLKLEVCGIDAKKIKAMFPSIFIEKTGSKLCQK